MAGLVGADRGLGGSRTGAWGGVKKIAGRRSTWDGEVRASGRGRKPAEAAQSTAWISVSDTTLSLPLSLSSSYHLIGDGNSWSELEWHCPRSRSSFSPQ